MFENDPERVAGCVERLRYSIKIVPWAVVPLSSATISLPGMAFGIGPMLFLAGAGLIVGFYFSVIIATFLESMALLLLSAESQRMQLPSPATNDSTSQNA